MFVHACYAYRERETVNISNSKYSDIKIDWLLQRWLYSDKYIFLNF